MWWHYKYMCVVLICLDRLWLCSVHTSKWVAVHTIWYSCVHVHVSLWAHFWVCFCFCFCLAAILWTVLHKQGSHWWPNFVSLLISFISQHHLHSWCNSVCATVTVCTLKTVPSDTSMSVRLCHSHMQGCSVTFQRFSWFQGKVKSRFRETCIRSVKKTCDVLM